MHKIPPAKMVWSSRKNSKLKKSKEIATATTEGTRKRGRPRKRWRYEVEEDFNKMDIKTGRH